MASASQHQEKAEHHLNFLKTISDDFPDWMATVAFYAAVELVEQLFAERGIHSRSHEDRNQAVGRNFRSIKQAYKALYNASMDARYESKEHWVSLGEVKEELIARRLHHIQTFICSHLTSRKTEAKQ
jgi:hypothetical protein